jgi:hypothetical protein
MVDLLKWGAHRRAGCGSGGGCELGPPAARRTDRCRADNSGCFAALLAAPEGDPTMTSRKASALCALLIAVASGATLAQTIYKSIGPDGKVVYSQQPSGDTPGRHEVIRGTQPSRPLPPLHGAATPSEPAATATPSRDAAPKQATRKATPAAEAAAAAPDPALEGAVIGVLGIEDLLRQSQELCTRALPTSFKRYTEPVAAWEQRNAATLAQARSALERAFAPPQRETIRAGVKLKNQGSLDAVAQAPLGAKIKWCDRNADELANGVLDVHNKPKLTAPLASYRG